MKRKEFIKLDMNKIDHRELDETKIGHWERSVKQCCKKCMKEKYMLNFNRVDLTYDTVCKNCIKKEEEIKMVMSALRSANLL